MNRLRLFIIVGVLALTLSRCGAGAKPQIFQNHAVYAIDLFDVYGQLVWKGALDHQRAVMYSAFDAPQVPPYRIYFNVIAVESVAIEGLYEGRDFRGTGLKLQEVAEPTADSPDFATLEGRVLDRLGPEISRERFVAREAFAAFELLIASDPGDSFNLSAEEQDLRPWSGWAGEAFSIGRLAVAPLDSVEVGAE